jgi:diguanylate cyclase (GGDEF)-like protein
LTETATTPLHRDGKLTREAETVAEGPCGTEGEFVLEDSAEAGRGAALTQEIYDRLRTVDLRTDALDDALREMEVPHGDAVYSELLHILCNLRFDSEEAKQLWSGILEHRGAMERRLGTLLDLRVALFSYFVEIKHKLINPKIIELSDFERTRESAYTDHLTGLRNYRFFVEQLNHEVLRADQYDYPLSLIMLDVDHFKHFNDRNGHEAGNEILQRIGGIIRGTLRKVDVGARYGGEEFAIVLPSTPKTGAHLAAERLRVAIETHDFPHAAHQPLGKLTASLGVATYPADARIATEFVEQTDRALYLAKANGRNRVCILDGGTRSFPRIFVELDGRCRVDGMERPIRTIELGTGGMSFRTTTGLTAGSLVDAEIVLPTRAPGIAVSGRILRVKSEHDGWVQAALRFVEIVPEDRRLLSAFVRNPSASRAPAILLGHEPPGDRSPDR